MLRKTFDIKPTTFKSQNFRNQLAANQKTIPLFLVEEPVDVVLAINKSRPQAFPLSLPTNLERFKIQKALIDFERKEQLLKSYLEGKVKLQNLTQDLF